jgi:putative ABC transport system permease protein
MTTLRHSLRSLLRTPVFSVTAGLTLVLGLAASIAIFAVVNAVLLRSLPYGSADRLVGAWHDLPPINLQKTTQTPSTWLTYQRLARTIEGIGIYQESAANVGQIGGAGEAQRVDAAWVSHELIPLMQVQPLKGRAFRPDEDVANGPSVVVISEDFWRSKFGADPAIVGKSMDVGGTSREIVGVMPARYRFPTPKTQLWLPLQLDRTGSGDGFSYNAVARLKPGVSLEDAQRDFAAVLPRIVELYPNFVPGVTTQQLMDQAKPVPVITSLRDDVVGGISRTLWMVAAAAGLLLLVACANVTNLMLVRADGRQRELAVREALGASRARVLGHFLSESAVLTVTAGIAALGLAWIALRALLASPVMIPRVEEVGIDAASVAFALLAMLLVIVFVSIFPALRIGQVQLSKALREGGRGGTSGKAQQRVRGALVAAQIAIAVVVLAGSGLLLRSFQRLNAVQPGFNADNVATLWVSLPRARYLKDTAIVRFYAQLDERLSALQGVEHAGMTSRLPLTSNGMKQNPFYPEDDAATWANKIPPLQLYTTVDGDYFRAMSIPIIAGRTFVALDGQSATEAVISRKTAVQFWNDSTGQRALGKRFRSLPNGPLYTVIGVAGDTRDSSLAKAPAQAAYFPNAMGGDTVFTQVRRTMAIVLKGKPGVATSSLISAAQAIVREMDSSLPTFDVRPMAQVWASSVSQLRFTMLILGTAAAVTLLLGAIGLYGVLAYAVTLRTRELGVRIALGAQPSEVAGMMARQGLALTAIGIVAGLGTFAVVARFLQSFLYGVAPADPLTLLATSVLLVAISALASWIPARRASRVDPAETLRSE